MSLKTVHLFFIFISILLTLVFSFWALWDYHITGNALNLAMGLVAFFGVGLLVWYGIWFFRKLKGWSYL